MKWEALICLLAAGGLVAQPEFNPKKVVPPFDAIVEPKAVAGEEAAAFVRPEELVLGVVVNGKARAYPINQLMRIQVLNLEAAGEEVLVTFAREGKRAQAFDRRLDDRSYRFESAGGGKMTDLATGSTWDAVTGECLAGKLQGRKLSRRPGTISYREAWKTFFPKGKIEE